MAQVNVTIIGLGKVGASMGLALKALNKQAGAEHQFTIVGHDGTPSLLDQAQKIGAVDRTERNLANSVEKADLVFIDLPFHQVETALMQIADSLKAGAVVIDASPLKMPPIQWAKKHFRRASSGGAETYLVGVRPLFNPALVGDHRDDVEAASADLFSGGVMVIAPAADCPEEAVQLVADLCAMLGIKAHFADPAELDGIAAAMESLPLLLQLALFRGLNKSKSWDDLRWLGNTAFFLGTYQIGQADAEAMGKLLHQSREPLLRRLDEAMDVMRELREVLESGDELAIAEAFDEASNAYAKWDKARHNNDWVQLPDEGISEVAGARPLGKLFSFGKKK
ncbi:MAG: prephenate dehydrogenase/arogenate dehydrogenase family protein [Anaerolineae bacterium]|nr:prephenate dehydrogenase/arogenate dehydrogenase family protein [Anaerolineae bacterium]